MPGCCRGYGVNINSSGAEAAYPPNRLSSITYRRALGVCVCGGGGVTIYTPCVCVCNMANGWVQRAATVESPQWLPVEQHEKKGRTCTEIQPCGGQKHLDGKPALVTPRPPPSPVSIVTKPLFFVRALIRAKDAIDQSKPSFSGSYQEFGSNVLSEQRFVNIIHS